MVALSEIRKQLVKVGYRLSVWQASEVKELCNVLSKGEVIEFATNGHYEGGFALLVATNHRLILVDKKPMFLTLDSITYAMMQEVLFSYRLLNSTIHVFTSNKSLDFTSWSHAPLRSIFTFTQMRMLQSRMGTDSYLIRDQNQQPVKVVQPLLDEDVRAAEESAQTNEEPEIAYEEQVTRTASTQPGELIQQDERVVNEPDFDEVPSMPMPQPQPDLLKTANIAMLGSSALESSRDNRLTAYKTPPLGQRRYVNRYL